MEVSILGMLQAVSLTYALFGEELPTVGCPRCRVWTALFSSTSF